MSRIQRAYQTVTDDGFLHVHVYGPVGHDGKQAVHTTLDFDCTLLPSTIANQCRAKGVGFYMSGRYSPKDADTDMTPDDVIAECNRLYTEMEKGQFTPGRGGGEARPSPFHEALAEFLKLPIHVLQEKLKDKTTYTQAKLAAMGRHPAVASISARITKERAAEAERAAKAKARQMAGSGDTGIDLFAGLADGASTEAA